MGLPVLGHFSVVQQFGAYLLCVETASILRRAVFLAAKISQWPKTRSPHAPVGRMGKYKYSKNEDDGTSE